MNGTLAPGNSPGTMTFAAPVTIGATGTLSLDIDGTGTGTGAGNYSRLVLTGTGSTFTAGGTLRPVLRGITGAASNSFTPAVGQSFVVVQAPSAVLGSFARIDQPTAGLAPGTRFDVTYGNNVNLFVTPGSYADLSSLGVTLTDNQAAIGTEIDALRGNADARPDPANAATLATIYNLGVNQLPLLADQLDGGVYGDALRASAARSQSFGRLVDARSDEGARGGGQLWLTGYGQTNDLGSSLDRRSYGFAGGLGARIGEHGLLGIGAGYDKGKLMHRASGDTADIDLVHVVAYGAFAGTHLFGRFHAGATRTGVSASRAIPQLGSTARGRSDGWGFEGAVEAGYNISAGGWSLSPTIGIRSAQVRFDGFAESGAGPVSLIVQTPRFSSVRAVAGVQIVRDVPVFAGATLRPQLEPGYLRELDDRAARTDVAFAGAPATRARITSAANGRDGLHLGAGVLLATASRVSVFMRGAYDTQSNVDAKSAAIGLGYRW